MVNKDDPNDVANLWSYGPPFQVGDSANGKNANYGASGWLYFVHDSAGTVYGDSTVHWDSSDFLMDLKPVISFCGEGDSVCVWVNASDPDNDLLRVFSSLGLVDTTGQLCFVADTAGTYCIDVGAVDSCQNYDYDTCKVVIEIDGPPQIICRPDIRFECESVGEFEGPTVLDEHPETVVLTMRTDSIPGNCPHSYQLHKWWFAADECGQVDSCRQIMSVYDDTPPVITCPDTVYVDCPVPDSIDLGMASAIDNCDTLPTIHRFLSAADLVGT